MTESVGYLKKGMEAFLKTDVISYFMIQEDGEKLYIIFGKRGFFLVDFNPPNPNDPPLNEKYYYAWIHDVIVDTDDTTLVMIRFKENREPLYLNSSVRNELVDELHVCWKTDFMYRRWEVCDFPLKDGVVPLKTKLSEAMEFTSPWEDHYRHEFGDYFFFLKNDFKAGWNPKTRQYTGDYMIEGNAGGEAFKVVQKAKRNVAFIGKWEKDVLRLEAEKEARRMAADEAPQQQQAMINSLLIEKRVNLTGDVASYMGWMTHVRTESRDIAVLFVRRKFIPPEGAVYQDVVFKYTGRDRTLLKRVVLIESMQKIIDSISPLRPVQFYDDTLATVKSQALLYDEESYAWFAAQGFKTSIDDGARALFKSVYNVLKDACPEFDDPDEMEKNEQLIDDPFDIISDMEADAPGLTPTSSLGHWEVWKEKVARYFAYILDGGLHPNTYDLTLMAKLVVEGKCGAKSEEMVIKLLDYALYLKARGDSYSRSQSLGEKITDENIIKDFSVNERVLGLLLQTGYIEKIVTDQVGKKAYVSFLTSLLKRENTAYLTIDAARAVAVLSSDISGRNQLVKAHIIQILVPYLQVNHEEIVLATGRALVNLTGDNMKAKVDVVMENGIRFIVQNNHLTDKSPEVIKTMCTLIKNCLNAEEAQRNKIAQDGVGGPLLELIREPAIEGLKQRDDVIWKAAAAIWNLCGSGDGKEEVTQLRGVEALVQALMNTENGEVLEKCSGALMVLCASHDENKKKAVTTESFLSTLIDKTVKSDNKLALRNVVGLLSVLSTLDLYKQFREETAFVIDKVGKVMSAETQKKKKDRRMEKLQQFLDMLQKNMAL